jgi:hypothetical protein
MQRLEHELGLEILCPVAARFLCVPLDHYIPKCLTRPWHDTRIGAHSLQVFDFETQAYTVRNSERFLATRRQPDSYRAVPEPTY